MIGLKDGPLFYYLIFSCWKRVKIKFISRTRNRHIMKFKTFRKLKYVVLNLFAIMIFISHVFIFLKTFRVGRHKHFHFFYISIKLQGGHKKSGSVGLVEAQLYFGLTEFLFHHQPCFVLYVSYQSTILYVLFAYIFDLIHACTFKWSNYSK